MKIHPILSKRGLLCIAMLGYGCILMAEDFTLPSVFNSNMVLQQNATVPI